MLIKTYELLTLIKEQIPFESTITISLTEEEREWKPNDDVLVVQVLFRKKDTPYFFKDYFTKEQIEDKDKIQTLIDIYIAELKDFYNKANLEDYNERELLNQTVQ